MAIILNIETATEICSVSLSKDGQILALKETHEANSHSMKLSIFIQDILKEVHLKPKDLQAVAVSSGPGSYTGLRIGVSLAKGLCYGLNIPLIAIPTLESMAYKLSLLYTQNELFAPMIDAGRMEVYTALFDQNLNRIENEKPQIIEPNSFETYLKSHEIVFCGNGSLKCQPIIKSSHAQFEFGVLPSANYMGFLADKYYQEKRFENTAYFEPFYLKEFQAKVSIVKGLN